MRYNILAYTPYLCTSFGLIRQQRWPLLLLIGWTFSSTCVTFHVHISIFISLFTLILLRQQCRVYTFTFTTIVLTHVTVSWSLLSGRLHLYTCYLGLSVCSEWCVHVVYRNVIVFVETCVVQWRPVWSRRILCGCQMLWSYSPVWKCCFEFVVWTTVSEHSLFCLGSIFPSNSIQYLSVIFHFKVYIVTFAYLRYETMKHSNYSVWMPSSFRILWHSTLWF